MSSDYAKWAMVQATPLRCGDSGAETTIFQDSYTVLKIRKKIPSGK